MYNSSCTYLTCRRQFYAIGDVNTVKSLMAERGLPAAISPALWQESVYVAKDDLQKLLQKHCEQKNCID